MTTYSVRRHLQYCIAGWFSGAMLGTAINCYYNPVPESVKGDLVCSYEGQRAFVGDIRINGEAITNGLRTLDLNGSWKLCNDNQPIQCVLTTTSTAG
jgi:hypothetical protein